MIHIVDDEEAIRDALQFLFASRGLEARGWTSGEAFLAAQPLADCTAIILDVRMDGISGPEVFERLRTMGIATPVIFLTGHADVPTAVATACVPRRSGPTSTERCRTASMISVRRRSAGLRMVRGG